MEQEFEKVLRRCFNTAGTGADVQFVDLSGLLRYACAETGVKLLDLESEGEDQDRVEGRLFGRLKERFDHQRDEIQKELNPVVGDRSSDLMKICSNRMILFSIGLLAVLLNWTIRSSES